VSGPITVFFGYKLLASAIGDLPTCQHFRFSVGKQGFIIHSALYVPQTGCIGLLVGGFAGDPWEGRRRTGFMQVMNVTDFSIKTRVCGKRSNLSMYQRYKVIP
jgi:hypothetical protein